MRSYLFILLIPLIFVSSGCEHEYARHVIAHENAETAATCPDASRVLNFGFYAHFPPISYATDADPTSPAFNTHLGYEADLLTALDAIMEGVTFTRTAIPTWEDIWLKSAEPAYDMIGGGITILESRTRDTTGQPRIVFTAGHITFRQTLLVRAADAERLATHAALTSEIRVGVVRGTTGETRLLELMGLVNSNNVLIAGTRIETPDGTFVGDGTAAYTISAAQVSPNLAARQHLYPPTEQMPQVVYLNDAFGNSGMLEALAAGQIDAIARGEIGNTEAAHGSHGAFVVTAFDAQEEYGGFTLALEDADLAACIDEKLDYLTDNRKIGYAAWLADPSVFMKRVFNNSPRE